MDLRSPTPWLIGVLVVLLFAGGFSGIALSQARDAAEDRLVAQADWAVLEAMMSEQMTRASHGSAPFEAGDVEAQQARVQERAHAVNEVAPHAEQAVTDFVAYLFSISTPADAAREGPISRLIIDTRSAVLGPLRERAERWDRIASWSLGGTGVLAVAGVGVALWRVGRQ